MLLPGESVTCGKAVLYRAGTPLASPVRCGREDVPGELKRELQELMHPAPAAFFVPVVSGVDRDWRCHFHCIPPAQHMDNHNGDPGCSY
jgi:hypothetical protein